MTANRLTPFQRRKKEREKKLFAEYKELYSDPGQSRVEAMKYLADKYGFATIQGVYKAVNRLNNSNAQ